MDVMTPQRKERGAIQLIPLAIVALILTILVTTSKDLGSARESILGRTDKGKSDSVPGRSADKNGDDAEDDVSIVVTGDGEEKGRGRGRKLKLESVNGNLLLNEEGTITVVDEDDEIEIEEGDEIEIGDGDDGVVEVEPEDGGIVIKSNGTRTRTNFPLSVDSSTNELIVTTPSGVKRVTVLPDVAIANMIKAGFIDVATTGGGEEPTPDPSESPIATGSGSPTPTTSGSPTPSSTEVPEPEAVQVTLTTTTDGELVYVVDGEKFEKLFGVFTVNIKKRLIISAETGEIMKIEKSLFNRILDVLSIDST